MSFLHQLNLPLESLQKLESLGADSAEALLSIALAAPEAFSSFMGPAEADLIRRKLRSLIDPARLSILQSPAPSFALGANLSNFPQIPNPSFDIAHRDRLFAEIQSLRNSSNPADALQLSRLEAELNQLLEKS